MGQWDLEDQWGLEGRWGIWDQWDQQSDLVARWAWDQWVQWGQWDQWVQWDRHWDLEDQWGLVVQWGQVDRWDLEDQWDQVGQWDQVDQWGLVVRWASEDAEAGVGHAEDLTAEDSEAAGVAAEVDSTAVALADPPEDSEDRLTALTAAAEVEAGAGAIAAAFT